MRNLIPAAFVTLVGLSLLAGCGPSSGQKESCTACRGTGRSASGSACLSCRGTGCRELSRSEVDRRNHAEANLRRKANGEEPLSDTEWWWEAGGKGLVGFFILGLAFYFLTGQHRRGRGPSPSPAPPTSPPPNT